jgi:hypothetical protein
MRRSPSSGWSIRRRSIKKTGGEALPRRRESPPNKHPYMTNTATSVPNTARRNLFFISLIYLRDSIFREVRRKGRRVDYQKNTDNYYFYLLKFRV